MFDWLLEEDAVVAAAEAEATLGRFKLLHVSVPGAEVAVDAVKDVDRRLAIDCAKISACFGRPENREARRICFGHSLTELSQDFLMRDAFTTGE